MTIIEPSSPLPWTPDHVGFFFDANGLHVPLYGKENLPYVRAAANALPALAKALEWALAQLVESSRTGRPEEIHLLKLEEAITALESVTKQP